MDHESSEAMIPGHDRQQSAGQPVALGEHSRRAVPDYDGFEDLTDDGPGIAGECPDY